MPSGQQDDLLQPCRILLIENCDFNVKHAWKYNQSIARQNLLHNMTEGTVNKRKPSILKFGAVAISNQGGEGSGTNVQQEQKNDDMISESQYVPFLKNSGAKALNPAIHQSSELKPTSRK